MEYKGPGCYRFLNREGQVIYVGSSKNIKNRIYYHFSKYGHLGYDVYRQVAIIELCKTEDFPTALALEQFLINEYKPIYNKRDKSKRIGSRVVKDESKYKKMEKWVTYKALKKLDTKKISSNKRQSVFVAAATYMIYFLVVYMLLKH